MSQFLPTPPRLNTAADLDSIFAHVLKTGASDLFFSGLSPIRMGLHGRKHRLTERNISPKEVESVLQDIYGVNAPAQVGSANPIDTAFEYRLGDKRFRFRLNVSPNYRGGRDVISLAFRSIASRPPTARELNIEPEILETCRNLTQGLVLVVGATGNGKSTLLSSILRDRVEDPTYDPHLLTIESPIEFVYDGLDQGESIVTQMEVGKHIKSFSAGVVNAMRQAPQIILVGESRDQETMERTLEAADTGHVVYTTLHADSVSTVFQRISRLADKADRDTVFGSVADVTRLIVAQTLVPSTDGKRIALREYMPIDDELRARLSDSSNMPDLLRSQLPYKGCPMARSAQRAYEKGLIDASVLKRVKLNFGEDRAQV